MAGTAELAVVIKARDETGKVLDSLKGKTNSLAGSLGKTLRLGGLAAAGGIGIAAVALKGFVNEAAEAQKVQAQTNAVIASTKGVAGVTAQAVNDLANELSRVIPIDDELIASTQNMLLTFTNIGKNVFPQATEAALDMATALGEDPVNAAMRLGKALNDPIRGVTALRRVGVQLTAQQEDQIKAMVEVGDVAGAQKVILGELATEFGNSGRAAGDTFAGKMKILQTQIGNVKETIGNALIPILTLGATALANFVADHQDDIERFAQLFSQKVVVAIQEVVAFFIRHKETINGFFESFKRGLETLRPLFEFIINNKPALVAAITAIGVAILIALGPGAAAVIAIVGLITLIGYLRDNWRDVLAAIQGFLQGFVDWIRDHWVPILIGVLGGPALLAIYVFRDDISAAIDEIIGFFLGMPMRIVAALGELSTLLFNKGADLIQGFIDGMKSLPIPNPLDMVPGGGLAKDIIKGAGGLFGGVFHGGGIVPGPLGAPRMILAQGGEQVLTPAQQRGGAGGASFVFNITADPGWSEEQMRKMARNIREEFNTDLRRTGLQGTWQGGGLFA